MATAAGKIAAAVEYAPDLEQRLDARQALEYMRHVLDELIDDQPG